MKEVREMDKYDYSEDYKNALIILFNCLNIDVKPIIEEIELEIDGYTITTIMAETVRTLNRYYSFSFINKCYDEKAIDTLFGKFKNDLYSECMSINKDYDSFYTILIKNIKSIINELYEYVIKHSEIKEKECNSLEEYLEMIDDFIKYNSIKNKYL